MSITFKQLNKKLKQAERDISKSLDKSFYNNVGKNIVDIIKKRTLKGKGVENKKIKKYESLKESTKKRRKYLKKKGKLDSRTSPEKSNQIESGKFIDGIHHKVISQGVEIKPSNNRKDMAKGQEKSGRTTFELTKREENKIKKEIDIKLKKILGNIFN